MALVQQIFKNMTSKLFSGDIVYIKKFPGKPFDPKKSFQRELKGKSNDNGLTNMVNLAYSIVIRNYRI